MGEKRGEDEDASFRRGAGLLSWKTIHVYRSLERRMNRARVLVGLTCIYIHMYRR